MGQTRHAPTRHGGVGVVEGREDLPSKRFRDALVGIEDEDPVVTRERERLVSRPHEAVPADADETRARETRPLLGGVRRTRVGDDDLVREGHRGEGRRQAILLVLRQDHDRERRAHGADINRRYPRPP